jgi:hypothetical protein
MRVLIVAAGSRGDVAPYTGLGVRLWQAGHKVRINAHAPFRSMVTGAAPFIYHVAQGRGVPSMGVYRQPFEPTGDFPSVVTNSARSAGRLGNRWVGVLLPGHPAAAHRLAPGAGSDRVLVASRPATDAARRGTGTHSVRQAHCGPARHGDPGRRHPIGLSNPRADSRPVDRPAGRSCRDGRGGEPARGVIGFAAALPA